MELLFPFITRQLNTIHEAVWDGLLNFAEYFIQPWRNLFWFCFNVYVCLWSEIGSLTVKILVLPFRIYNAIQKEDLMEEELQQMIKLHTESKERLRELVCELEQVLDECRQHKNLLEKVEGEKRAILKKFQVLQLRVMHLEEENDLLKSREERALKGIHERNILVLQQKNLENNRFVMESPKKECNMERNHNKDEFFMHTRYPRTPDLIRVTGKTPLQLDHKYDGAPGSTNKCIASHIAKYEAWKAAIVSSLFSVFLTLLVGAVAWEAQDPCIPLIGAVFMVVCMSLKTVAQFLLSICNGPGFDVVALLSFNWFVLGTLAYPVLPRIASIVAPYGTSFGHWFLRVIGVTYLTDRLKSAFCGFTNIFAIWAPEWDVSLALPFERQFTFCNGRIALKKRCSGEFEGWLLQGRLGGHAERAATVHRGAWRGWEGQKKPLCAMAHRRQFCKLLHFDISSIGASTLYAHDNAFSLAKYDLTIPFLI
ncbi:hypothetical protein GOP47_0007635 [Adiantum capillus-veneris]|uniref:Uncharacterized protein n=1 Tax=Adiantum capillus-veneris TaxID=13818 RepID=A0A9D4V1Q1_ADICA|nr:hypothetical protein GOP47_0007635 [Adiantum capillus-veneris]